MKRKLVINLKKRLINKKISFFALAFFTSFALLIPAVASLTSQKDQVEILYISNKEPVKIISLKIGETSVESGKKISFSSNLIKDLKVTVENNYGKTVSYIRVGVIVIRPEEQKNLPPFFYDLTLGNKKKALKKEDSGLEIRSEVNNNQADLFVSVDEYTSIRDSLDSLEYSSKIKKLIVQVEEVAFADGTIWSIGTWYKGDPNDEKKLIPLNSDDEVTKGGADKSTASSLATNINSVTEDCFTPLAVDVSCTPGGDCNARDTLRNGNLRKTHTAVYGYDRCFREDVNGVKTYCGMDIRVFRTLPCPTPTPTPTPRGGGGGCLSGKTIFGEEFKEGEDSSDSCSPCNPDPSEVYMCQQGGGTYDWVSCQCGQSPIVIDVLGNGFNLTNAANGVNFDINGDGTQNRLAWSAASSDDA